MTSLIQGIWRNIQHELLANAQKNPLNCRTQGLGAAAFDHCPIET